MKTIYSISNVVWDPGDIHFFNFELEFVEENLRCIPMIVRFKLDACGIKLKLEEWCLFTHSERDILVYQNCITEIEKEIYRDALENLVSKKTGELPTKLIAQGVQAWAKTKIVYEKLLIKAEQLNVHITHRQWEALTNLQRFALIKLSSQNHESKNLPKALIEFGFVKQ